ncbi:MAG: hypothetical protein AAF170_04645 [Bacteroidota bacterium]
MATPDGRQFADDAVTAAVAGVTSKGSDAETAAATANSRVASIDNQENSSFLHAQSTSSFEDPIDSVTYAKGAKGYSLDAANNAANGTVNMSSFAGFLTTGGAPVSGDTSLQEVILADGSNPRVVEVPAVPVGTWGKKLVRNGMLPLSEVTNLGNLADDDERTEVFRDAMNAAITQGAMMLLPHRDREVPIRLTSRMEITSPVQIVGHGRELSIIDCEHDEIVLLIDKNDAQDPVPGVRFANFMVRSLNGFGRTDGGLIQANNAIDWRCINVAVIADNNQLVLRGRDTNGISTSNGTTGIIRGCVCDGLTKPLFYISSHSQNMVVVDCYARNGYNDAFDVPGFFFAGGTGTLARGIVSEDCPVGLQISTIGAPTNLPTRDVRVMSGRLEGGKVGILIGSQTDITIQPTAIRILPEVVCTGQSEYGARVTAGDDLDVHPTVELCQFAGVFLDNASGLLGENVRCDPQVLSAGLDTTTSTWNRSAIAMRGVQAAKISERAKLVDTQDTPTMTYAVAALARTANATLAETRCQNIDIRNPQIGGQTLSPNDPLVQIGTATAAMNLQTGYVEYKRFAAPSLNLPQGSMVYAGQARTPYLNVGGGTDWRRPLPFGANATVDFPSIAAHSDDTSITVTVSGANVGDSVKVTPLAPLTAGLVVDGYVSSADTVTLIATNTTAGAIDEPSRGFFVQVTQRLV